MSKSILVLGRQPELGIAELESLYGPESITEISPNIVSLSLDPRDIDFERLGGSVKLAKYLTDIDSTKWSEIFQYLNSTIPKHLDHLPEGKLKLGMSVYNLNASANDINRTLLGLKKTIKASGRSVRVIPNKAQTLNSAQVLYNQLTNQLGWELLLIRDGNKTILAQTVREQDIDAYAARDQNRPKRDSKVGMLPPKLAQIIINLADRGQKNEGYTKKTVLDPFCGTGVVLQESLLIGYSAYGTDIEPRMIDYSKANLEWVSDKIKGGTNYQLEVKDAMQDKWDKPFDIVACETYLGRPLATEPDSDTLNKIIQDCNFIHKKFLTNILGQIESDTLMSIAVPVWKIKGQNIHLPILDHLEEIGYTELSFVHTKGSKLIYRREDQIVGREIIILTKSK
ncbi:hypothetical protein KC946_02795 [Candidatus Saccharibacteria bacterium]|nr:hypothetical protein [Candidatus Saccharibacteria bacterium]